MSDAKRLPIVLCCAEESEVALVAVVDLLHREGHAPELVPGVDADVDALTAAADRLSGPALFVLCQSEGLGRVQVRRLEGLFSARKGPEHRMVMVDVAGRSAASVVVEVRAAARELLRGSGGRSVDDGHYMRDVVVPTSVAAVPGATVPQRAPRSRGRELQRSSSIAREPEGISEEALGLDSGDSAVVDVRELHSLVPEPEVLLGTNAESRAALAESGFEPDGMPSDGVPLAIAEDFPVVGASSQDVEIRGAPGRVGWDHSGPVDLERVARPLRSDPRAETDETPLPSSSTPIDVGKAGAPAVPKPRPEDEVGAPPPGRVGRLILLVVAAAGMAGVVTMAVLHATAPVGLGPSAETHDRGAPLVSSPAADADLEVEAPEPEPEPRVVAATAATTDEPQPAAATGNETGEPALDGEAASPDETGGEEASNEETGNDEIIESGHGDGGKLVPPPPHTEDDDDSLGAAIAAGRVHEAGELLVVLTGPSTVTWEEAATRCSRRKVAGLTRWRLATMGQLNALRRANVLTYGSFWSRSAVGTDEVLVLDAASGRTNRWLKIEPTGRVVCVHARR